MLISDTITNLQQSVSSVFISFIHIKFISRHFIVSSKQTSDSAMFRNCFTLLKTVKQYLIKKHFSSHLRPLSQIFKEKQAKIIHNSKLVHGNMHNWRWLHLTVSSEFWPWDHRELCRQPYNPDMDTCRCWGAPPFEKETHRLLICISSKKKKTWSKE